MNVFEKVKAAADSIGIYACPDLYTKGDQEMWITYNLAFEQGAIYGDDIANDLTSGVQIHLFLDKDTNFFAIRRQLRAALIEQGFTHPEMVLNSLEDNKIRHIVFECEHDAESED